MTARLFTPEQDAMLAAAYAAGEPSSSLAAKFNTTISPITKAIKRAGGTVRTLSARNRRYPLNDAAFMVDSETEPTSYFAGLLMADGNVRYEPTHLLRIVLHPKDKAILVRFKSFLGTDRPLHVYPNGNLCLAVSSEPLVLSLAKYGIVPRKTPIARAPDFLLGNRHFWRGCVDGDGYVRVARHSPRGLRRSAEVSLCGTREIVEQFREYVASVAPSRATIRTNGTSHACWKVVYTGVAATVILKELYRDTDLAIPRKLALAQEGMAFTYHHHLR